MGRSEECAQELAPQSHVHSGLNQQDMCFLKGYRLVGLVVKASALRAEGPGFESRLRWDFFGVESYQ